MGGDDLELQANARVGTTLRDKYHLDSVLGVGGMAAVYAATHRNRKRFAVKMLHSVYSVHESVRSRFLREGYVANSVGHPASVMVLDDDIAEDGAAFVVMELLEGETVESLWQRSGGRLSVEVTLGVAYQLLDMLSVAHDKKVVHRDIKPENLFITQDGMLKVLDFGIARLRETDEGAYHTGAGVTMGTPAFMAPEQARGATKQVGPCSDIWSVGATMFVLLSGRSVHVGKTIAQQVEMNAGLAAPSLATAVSSLPASLVAVVDRALRFAPEQRWPSAGAMRDAVADVAADLGITLPPARAPSERSLKVAPARTPRAVDLIASAPTEVQRAPVAPPPRESAPVAVPAALPAPVARAGKRGAILGAGIALVLVGLVGVSWAVLRSTAVPKPIETTSTAEDAATPTTSASFETTSVTVPSARPVRSAAVAMPSFVPPPRPVTSAGTKVTSLRSATPPPTATTPPRSIYDP